ncbi:Conserved hypothetical protein, flavoprotein-like protein [Cynara cardunculus var. scolymus]|uniref:Uncharacterized protein n=1 Tax=Cynara cardunculus var. scolymus TaxID=59895 RepID=A0A103Y4T3_CYNCS|nr:Conserved hypothetical protein, flavoprotein-like protein [Cynara cardunculus var. scolymus]
MLVVIWGDDGRRYTSSRAPPFNRQLYLHYTKQNTMKCTVSRSIFHNLLPPNSPSFSRIYVHFTSSTRRRRFGTVAFSQSPEVSDERMVVVGGGAAGIYGAIRAKTLAPNLNVVVIEKGKPLAKVKVSGGGRCNVTNGHCADNMILAEQYPRGSREFRGSFFNVHGPGDTMSWFSDHGVKLKIEEDGRVFPVSDNSSSIVDCLLNEARQRGVTLQTGKSVTSASTSAGGKFILKIEKRTIDYVDFIEADYLLIASGSSQQGYNLATQLGHSIIKPVPSLFTFKIDDTRITELSGVGPMLVTHWGLSGPVILRLSAWGARDLYRTLLVDFSPDLHSEDLKSLLSQHKKQFPKQKVVNSYPPELGLMKRFWRYLLNREVGIDEDILWASISNNSLMSVASLLKQCSFIVKGKISLKTMESRIQSHLFFAGEVLNVDGITGGFNFQNAWSGGYIAGTSIGKMAAASAPATLKELAM